MTRSRSSAKAAGARFERDVADYLAAHVDDRIDHRPAAARGMARIRAAMGWDR